MKAINLEAPPAYAGRPRWGGWVQTYTGRAFWPLDPDPDEIDIRDIAHSLSLQCRFAGHCDRHYSVAEHCVRVAREVPHSDKLWALLHDAAETYLVDLPRPLKRSSGLAEKYQEVEANLMAAVCHRFGLPLEMPESVHMADLRLLETEQRDLMNGEHDKSLWTMGVEPLKETIPDSAYLWAPPTAELLYLANFEEYGGKC